MNTNPSRKSPKPAAVMWLLLAGATAAWAQVAIPPATPAGSSVSPLVARNLSFDAKLVSSGGSTKVNNTGSTGLVASSLDNKQTHQSSMRLEIHVHNFGTIPVQAKLECYFVARGVGAKANRYIWDKVDRDLPLPAGADLPETIGSAPLTFTTERSVQDSTRNVLGQTVVTETLSRRESGSKAYGWIVRLMVGDQVVKVQGSSSDLEAAGRDSQQLAALEKARPPAVPGR